MVLRVKRPSPSGIRLKLYLWLLPEPYGSKNNRFRPLSRHLRHCCVGYTPSPKARWVTPINIYIQVLIYSWSFSYYRCMVWPSCRFAQPISCAIWRFASCLERLAILQYLVLCTGLQICSQVWTVFFCELNAYLFEFDKWSTRPIWREFSRPICLFENIELFDAQVLSMQGLVI